MDDAVITAKKDGEFLLKMGKNFNSVAEKYSMKRSELFAAIFDQYLDFANFPMGENRLLVATVKHPDPRVTLLISRQSPGESLDRFKWNFAQRVERYLTSDRCEKDFPVILAIGPEKIE